MIKVNDIVQVTTQNNSTIFGYAYRVTAVNGEDLLLHTGASVHASHVTVLEDKLPEIDQRDRRPDGYYMFTFTPGYEAAIPVPCRIAGGRGTIIQGHISVLGVMYDTNNFLSMCGYSSRWMQTEPVGAKCAVQKMSPPQAEVDFQVGDIVRCIRGQSSALVEGQIYQVAKTDETYLYIGESTDGWYKDRFELVEKVNLDMTIRVGKGYLKLNEPDLDLIKIEDIAAALSKICRFSGQTPRFYSVAEHSVLALKYLMKNNVSSRFFKACLLHDAAEAYLGDMITPMKKENPRYREIEVYLQSLICKKFGVGIVNHHTIKSADMVMLKAEKKKFWPDDTVEWDELSGVANWKAPIRYYAPKKAEKVFLDAFVNCCENPG